MIWRRGLGLGARHCMELGRRWKSDGSRGGQVQLWRRSANAEVYAKPGSLDLEVKQQRFNLILTCEHASNALPDGYAWSEEDRKRGLPEQHWAFDPGAKDLTLELADSMGVPAICSRYSRLFVDVNRPLASNTMMRTQCDGLKVGLNENLSERDHHARIENFYIPYHLELGKLADLADARLIVSIHSYTRNYEGRERTVEVGVLCSVSDNIAKVVCDELLREGYKETKMNEPWSGRDGFMFAADSCAFCGPTPGYRQSLMLEMRNDLLTDKEWRSKFANTIEGILKRLKI